MRIEVFILAGLAYLVIYGIAAITSSPLSPGELAGEAMMARGGFFASTSPFAVLLAFVSAGFTAWFQKELTRPWL